MSDKSHSGESQLSSTTSNSTETTSSSPSTSPPLLLTNHTHLDSSSPSLNSPVSSTPNFTLGTKLGLNPSLKLRNHGVNNLGLVALVAPGPQLKSVLGGGRQTTATATLSKSSGILNTGQSTSNNAVMVAMGMGETTQRRQSIVPGSSLKHPQQQQQQQLSGKHLYQHTSGLSDGMKFDGKAEDNGNERRRATFYEDHDHNHNNNTNNHHHDNIPPPVLSNKTIIGSRFMPRAPSTVTKQPKSISITDSSSTLISPLIFVAGGSSSNGSSPISIGEDGGQMDLSVDDDMTTTSTTTTTTINQSHHSTSHTHNNFHPNLISALNPSFLDDIDDDGIRFNLEFSLFPSGVMVDSSVDLLLQKNLNFSTNHDKPSDPPHSNPPMISSSPCSSSSQPPSDTNDINIHPTAMITTTPTTDPARIDQPPNDPLNNPFSDTDTDYEDPYSSLNQIKVSNARVRKRGGRSVNTPSKALNNDFTPKFTRQRLNTTFNSNNKAINTPLPRQSGSPPTISSSTTTDSNHNHMFGRSDDGDDDDWNLSDMGDDGFNESDYYPNGDTINYRNNNATSPNNNNNNNINNGVSNVDTDADDIQQPLRSTGIYIDGTNKYVTMRRTIGPGSSSNLLRKTPFLHFSGTILRSLDTLSKTTQDLINQNSKALIKAMKIGNGNTNYSVFPHNLSLTSKNTPHSNLIDLGNSISQSPLPVYFYNTESDSGLIFDHENRGKARSNHPNEVLSDGNFTYTLPGLNTIPINNFGPLFDQQIISLHPSEHLITTQVLKSSRPDKCFNHPENHRHMSHHLSLQSEQKSFQTLGEFIQRSNPSGFLDSAILSNPHIVAYSQLISALSTNNDQDGDEENEDYDHGEITTHSSSNCCSSMSSEDGSDGENEEGNGDGDGDDGNNKDADDHEGDDDSEEDGSGGINAIVSRSNHHLLLPQLPQHLIAQDIKSLVNDQVKSFLKGQLVNCRSLVTQDQGSIPMNDRSDSELDDYDDTDCDTDEEEEDEEKDDLSCQDEETEDVPSKHENYHDEDDGKEEEDHSSTEVTQTDDEIDEDDGEEDIEQTDELDSLLELIGRNNLSDTPHQLKGQISYILPVTHTDDPFYHKLELFGLLNNCSNEDMMILNNLRSQKLKEIGMVLKSQPLSRFLKFNILYHLPQNGEHDHDEVLGTFSSPPSSLSSSGPIIKKYHHYSSPPPEVFANNRHLLRGLLKHYYSSIIASLNSQSLQSTSQHNANISSLGNMIDDGHRGTFQSKQFLTGQNKPPSSSLFDEFDDEGELGPGDNDFPESSHPNSILNDANIVRGIHHGFQISILPTNCHQRQYQQHDRLAHHPEPPQSSSQDENLDQLTSDDRQSGESVKTIGQLMRSCYYVKQFQQMNLKNEFAKYHKLLTLREQWEVQFDKQLNSEEQSLLNNHQISQMSQTNRSINDLQSTMQGEKKAVPCEPKPSSKKLSASKIFNILKRLDIEIDRQYEQIRLVRMHSHLPLLYDHAPPKQKLKKHSHSYRRSQQQKQQHQQHKQPLEPNLLLNNHNNDPRVHINKLNMRQTNHPDCSKLSQHPQPKIKRLIEMLTRLNSAPSQSKFILSSHQSNPTLLTNLPDFHINNQNLDDDETLYELLRYIDTISPQELFHFFQNNREIQFSIEDVVSIQQGHKYEVNIDLNDLVGKSGDKHDKHDKHDGHADLGTTTNYKSSHTATNNNNNNKFLSSSSLSSSGHSLSTVAECDEYDPSDQLNNETIFELTTTGTGVNKPTQCTTDELTNDLNTTINPYTDQPYENYPNILNDQNKHADIVHHAILIKTDHELELAKQIERLLVREVIVDEIKSKELQKDAKPNANTSSLNDLASQSIRSTSLSALDIFEHRVEVSGNKGPMGQLDTTSSLTLNSTTISFNPYYLSGSLIYSNQSLQPPILSRLWRNRDGRVLSRRGLFKALFNTKNIVSWSRRRKRLGLPFSRSTLQDGTLVYAPVPDPIGQVVFDGSFKDMVHFTPKPTHHLTKSSGRDLEKAAQLELLTVVQKILRERGSPSGVAFDAKKCAKNLSSRGAHKRVSMASTTKSDVNLNASVVPTSLHTTTRGTKTHANGSTNGNDRPNNHNISVKRGINTTTNNNKSSKKNKEGIHTSSRKKNSQTDRGPNETDTSPVISLSSPSPLPNVSNQELLLMTKPLPPRPPLTIQGDMVNQWTDRNDTHHLTPFGKNNKFITSETFEQQHYTTIPPPNSPFYRTGQTPIYLEQCRYPQVLLEIPANLRPLVAQCQVANLSLAPPTIAFRFNIQPHPTTLDPSCNEESNGVASSSSSSLQPPAIPIPYYLTFHGYLADPNTSSTYPMNISAPEHHFISQSDPIPVFKFTGYTIHPGYLPPITLTQNQLFLSYVYHALLVSRGELRKVLEDNINSIILHYGSAPHPSIPHSIPDITTTSPHHHDNPQKITQEGLTRITKGMSSIKPVQINPISTSRRTTRSQSSQPSQTSDSEVSDNSDDKPLQSMRRRANIISSTLSPSSSSSSSSRLENSPLDPTSLIGMLIKGLEPRIGTITLDISNNQLIYDVIGAKEKMAQCLKMLRENQATDTLSNPKVDANDNNLSIQQQHSQLQHDYQQQQQQQITDDQCASINNNTNNNNNNNNKKKNELEEERNIKLSHPLTQLNHYFPTLPSSSTPPSDFQLDRPKPLETPSQCLNLLATVVKMRSLSDRKMLLRDHFNLELIPQELQTLPQTFLKLAKIGTISHDFDSFLDGTDLLDGDINLLLGGGNVK